MEGMAETKSISLKDNTYKGMVRLKVTWLNRQRKKKWQGDGFWPKKDSSMYSKNNEKKTSGEKHWC